jgi:hypothetical protein
MRIPFLAGGRSSGDDPEHRKLLVAEGRVPRPFPGPWTLRALVRGEEGGESTPASPADSGPGAAAGAPDVARYADVPATGPRARDATDQDAP